MASSPFCGQGISYEKVEATLVLLPAQEGELANLLSIVEMEIYAKEYNMSSLEIFGGKGRGVLEV